MSTSSPYSFILKSDFLSIVVGGKPYQLLPSHPTFKSLSRAIKRKEWKRVPRLVSLSEVISNQSNGDIEVRKDGVYYKGTLVDNSLTKKIAELVEHNQPVSYLLKFMDNLYKNPEKTAIAELYEWLNNGRFVLTDDGCFLAYKAVDENFKDCHTHSVDNHPGAVPMMPRKEVDPNRYNECSRGYHFCSYGYLRSFSGQNVMAVKVNPKDVVSIPAGYSYSKGRTWRYEVLYKIGENPDSHMEESPVMTQLVVPIAKERKLLIEQLKALPSVKKLLRRGKLTQQTFRKASYGRLANWFKRFSIMDTPPEKSKLFENPLRFSRETAGLTLGQVAKEMDITLKAAYNAERGATPNQEVIDSWLEAIAKLTGNIHSYGAARAATV